MKEFYYKKGNLFAEEVKIKDVANHIKTPFYVYSKLAMERRFDQLKNSLGGLRHKIFYSVKANSKKTITELAYVPNDVEDGFYFMNIQMPNFKLDAAPSRPIIMKPL